MEKIKNILQGKKTYILAFVAIAAVWLDFVFGIGFSDVCKAAQDVATGCTVTFQEAMSATWASLAAVTIRAGIAKA